MSLDLPRATEMPKPPSILIVDDDQRVVELLEIAFQAHGYRILHAPDGDAALECARREHPSLVLLDVRLPRRSGYEVCERLRQDPDDPHVPIVMVSAVAEVEARVQGLSRGADDYVVKPFSPRELVARVQRLLARTGEAREARRVGIVVERELARARTEAERSQLELQRVRRVEESARSLAGTLAGCADAGAIATALLTAVTRASGVDGAAVLGRDPSGPERLTLLEARGMDRTRLRGLTLDRDAELVRLATGLGRVVRLDHLERLPEARHEVQVLTIAGFAELAALVAEDGLEGVLLLGERADGSLVDGEPLDEVAALGSAAARALAEARRLRSPLEVTLDLLTALAGTSGATPAALAAVEAQAIVEHVAGAFGFDAAVRRRVGRAVRLGTWTLGAAGAAQLSAAACADATGEIARLRRLVIAAHQRTLMPEVAGERPPAALVVLGWRALEERLAGLPAALAWGRAIGAVASEDRDLPRTVREALIARRREVAA